MTDLNCAFCWGDAKDVPAVTIANGHAVCADHFILATDWETPDRGGSSYRFLRTDQAKQPFPYE